MITEKLNGENTVFETVERPQTDEKMPDTHEPAKCGCISCGGREIPTDDIETRRKIERYRKKYHG